MTWLSKIEERSRLVLRIKLTKICRQDHKEKQRMARVIRELAGYALFLEAYCSERMSAEKARKRFILPPDAKELLSK